MNRDVQPQRSPWDARALLALGALVLVVTWATREHVAGERLRGTLLGAFLLCAGAGNATGRRWLHDVLWLAAAALAMGFAVGAMIGR